MLPLILSWLPSLLCAVHIVRSGQQYYWLWIVLAFGPLGAGIYFVVVMLPDLASGRKRIMRGLAYALVPKRETKGN